MVGANEAVGHQTEVEEPSVDVADDGELGFAREVDDVRLFALSWWETAQVNTG